MCILGFFFLQNCKSVFSWTEKERSGSSSDDKSLSFKHQNERRGGSRPPPGVASLRSRSSARGAVERTARRRSPPALSTAWQTDEREDEVRVCRRRRTRLQIHVPPQRSDILTPLGLHSVYILHRRRGQWASAPPPLKDSKSSGQCV